MIGHYERDGEIKIGDTALETPESSRSGAARADEARRLTRSSAKKRFQPTEEIANEAHHVCLDRVIRST